MCWCRRLAGLLVGLTLVAQLHAECTYQDVVFAAGSAVPVSEPCLRCVCARAGLLCQLRVCAELPDPPPPGCVALHRRKACCPQLLCYDEPVKSNRIEARLEPDFPEILYNQSMVGNGCVHGGTLYGAGSAMHTSSRCSYCYCIGGRQQCVRPRCLLPAPGCTPVFRPHACCPTSYKCRATLTTTAANTTDAVQPQHDPDSCLVQGVRVAAGARAVAAVRSPCDACYCVRGAVRCTPLRCAPALPGCTPLVPPTACCPTSYNCSGTIEVQPLLNYEKAPDVSPVYAKLRHGAHQPAATAPPGSQASPSPDSKYPHYVVAESHAQPTRTHAPYYFTSTRLPSPSRQTGATTKHLPLTDSNPENSGKYSRISFTTTRVANGEKIAKVTTEAASIVLSPVYKPNFENATPRNLKDSNDVDTEFSDDNSADARNNRRIDDQIEVTETSTTEFTTESVVITTDATTEFSTTTDPDLSTIETTTFFTTTEILQNTTEQTNKLITSTELVITNDKPVVKLIGNNSECTDGTTELENINNEEEFQTTIDPRTITVETTSTPSLTTIDNFEVSSETEASHLAATTLPFKKIPADVEVVNKKDEDYEYDYNLQPNLEIIPFVAADAVVEQATFPPLQDALRETDDPLFSYSLNLFSPPQETEGGFVPRDPPQLYGDYHVDRSDHVDCAVLGRQVRHGAPAPAGPACTRCLCLFGAVVCHPPQCNEGAEALNDAPFRDVIRTAPAPGLHELIGDLPTTTSERTYQQEEGGGDSLYDTLYQLLGGSDGKIANITTSSTSISTSTSTSTNPPTNTPWAGNSELGLLKLAGCNIYGRMYRVGKIIAELSGPCWECRCTDTGVQCAPLSDEQHN